jgi:hypothetical protein
MSSSVSVSVRAVEGQKTRHGDVSWCNERIWLGDTKARRVCEFAVRRSTHALHAEYGNALRCK